MKTFDLGPVTAYALAVKNGYKGTEKEWLDSLRGLGVPEPSLLYAGKVPVVNPEGTGYVFGDGGKQANWNQNDPTALDYVKNRTHYEGKQLVEVLVECQPTWNEDDNANIVENPPVLNAGETYIVNWNGTEYTCECLDLYALSGGNVSGLHLGNLVNMSGEDTGEPFYITLMYGVMICGNVDGSISVTLSIRQEQTVVRKLDNKYLDLEWLPVILNKFTSLVENATTNTGTSLTVVDIPVDLVEGHRYTIVFDGVTYEATAQQPDSTVITLETNGCPATIFQDLTGTFGTGLIINCPTAIWNTTHIVSVRKTEQIINEMPTKFLPDSVPYVAEGGMVEILPECQMTSEDGVFIIEQDFTLVAGETYIVNWNGTEYKCVGQDFSAIAPGIVCLGNCAELGGFGNGEPFVIAFEDVWVALPLDGTTELTLSIYQGGGAEIRKLDNRCLDLAWLPTLKEVCIATEKTVTNTIGAPTETTGGFPDLNNSMVSDGQILILYSDGVRHELTVVKGGSGADSFCTAASTDGSYDMVLTDSITTIGWTDGSASHVASVWIYTPNKMPAEFLPTDATVFYLTSPGGKKFAVTVADDGTLSAAEVTA